MPPSTRPSSWSRAPAPSHASGLVNAVLRRATRERAELTAALLGDESTPAAAAIAHSAPEWLARMWWEELGPEVARSLLAACNEPAEVALRADADREQALAALREAGVEAAAASGEWPLAAPEAIVIAGRTGKAVPEMVAAGSLTPQSRGSAAVVEVLDPQPGEHLLDLCAGPGIKTGQICERMEDRGEVISVELDPNRAAEVAAQAGRLGLRGVTVIEADAAAMEMAPGFDRVLLDAPCSDLGALASRPDARWRKSPKGIERLAADPGAGAARRRPGAEAGGDAGLRDLHDLPPRERGPRRGAARRGGGGRGAAAATRGPRRPRPGARLAAGATLPAAAPRPRPHDRILHRPPEAR